MAQKRADYFAVGTLVVWDADLLNEEVVAKYSVGSPFVPQIWKRGEEAEAVLGWKMSVKTLSEFLRAAK